MSNFYSIPIIILLLTICIGCLLLLLVGWLVNRFGISENEEAEMYSFTDEQNRLNYELEMDVRSSRRIDQTLRSGDIGEETTGGRAK